jgi:hypothetical protein
MNDATNDKRLKFGPTGPREMRSEPFSPARKKTQRPPVPEREPYEGWAPPGVDLRHVAPSVRKDIAAVVRPVYEDLVLAVPDGLERSTGLTIVHLMCQEIVKQGSLYSYQLVDPVLSAICPGEEPIEKYLRIVESKVRVSSILVQLRLYRLRRRVRLALPAPTAKPALLGIAQASAPASDASGPAIPASLASVSSGIPESPEARAHVAEIQNL